MSDKSKDHIFNTLKFYLLCAVRKIIFRYYTILLYNVIIYCKMFSLIAQVGNYFFEA